MKISFYNENNKYNFSKENEKINKYGFDNKSHTTKSGSWKTNLYSNIS